MLNKIAEKRHEQSNVEGVPVKEKKLFKKIEEEELVAAIRASMHWKRICRPFEVFFVCICLWVIVGWICYYELVKLNKMYCSSRM